MQLMLNAGHESLIKNRITGWNNEWIKDDKLKDTVNIDRAIYYDKLKRLKTVLTPSEFNVFRSYK